MRGRSVVKIIRTGLWVLGIMGLLGMFQVSTASAHTVKYAGGKQALSHHIGHTGKHRSSSRVASDPILSSSKMVSSRLGKSTASAVRVTRSHNATSASKSHLSQ